MCVLRYVVIVLWISTCATGSDKDEGCQSPQYVERGDTGIIRCSFQERYIGIYWYDSEDYINEDPILNFQDLAKYGKGYLSGEFDIHPNGSLIIKEVSIQHDHMFTVVKRISAENLQPFRVLVVVTGFSQNTTGNLSEVDNYYWMIGVVLPITLVLAIGLYFFTRKDLKETFIEQIKRKYEDLYYSVQPIPYIRDRLYCVDKVFVESGIEQLTSLQGKGQAWETLDTYHDILNEPMEEARRVIVEGEPGYGKSTLSLQLVYDWCNRVPDSPLKSADIVVFLRLRQLGGIKSIARAIKQFILPKDSALREIEIKTILYECGYLVFILDGYDEFPDDDNDAKSEVMDIVTRDIFQQSPVVLTTRTSYLPPKYAANTKRLKLTGFDQKARECYIRKAVIGKDDADTNVIIQQLQKNPVLGDLCQVPLFFVMFAHMTNERDEFQQYNSVTTFFRYMISCFHSHMRLKMEDENVEKSKLYEENHSTLDKVAFEGLSRKTQQIVWDKEIIRKRIGKGFYDQYIRTGILLEEEFVKLLDEPFTDSFPHIEYKTEVRFYHKLFCEWYAAHHLSKLLTRLLRASCRSLLQNMDPFDLQYVYRFACGLNTTAAKNIINYLKKTKDGEKFAILCILEQTGDVSNIMDNVRDLCSAGVEINGSDSNLLQRSTIQLLEIAFRNNVLVPSVQLNRCRRSFDDLYGELVLMSGVKLPKLTKVNSLLIQEEGNELMQKEVEDVLAFASMCTELKTLT
ncbi:NLR family CARD domain-containing protein 4 [Holothuria leucospilota]|uniref:NLR family CARD domain-containing protein 4 n=1 Tax=Holothuria leucospilota TaxID=206669 RepID=A0A9Q1HLQ8_HOLLE|nr:NLR family CARD domain-containing protein 4 [Holothuria leucospilota]